MFRRALAAAFFLASMCIDESLLPVWDLPRIYGYTGLNDPAFQAATTDLVARAEAFNAKYRDHLAEGLVEALGEYSAINEVAAHLDEFVTSVYATNQASDEVKKLYSAFTATRNTAFARYIEWFELQLTTLPIDEQDQAIQPYIEFVRRTRQKAPHLLAEPVEEALTVREAYFGVSPVVHFYNDMSTQATYEFDDPEQGHQTLNQPRILQKLSSENWKVREAALKAFNDGLALNRINKFATLSLNQVSGREAIERQERKFGAARSSRNLDNMIDDDIVQALLQAVRSKGVELNKRFYTLKRTILTRNTGRSEFTWADRNAPLGWKDMPKSKYEWSEAVATVDKAFADFSETFVTIFRKLVAEKRIDAPATSQKMDGAFCQLGTPTSGPLVLLNYLGEDRDVSTLAHECGHAIHAQLSYKQQFLSQRPTLVVCECASVFGEMLVFRRLLKETEAPQARLAKLMDKLNDIMNTVVRQVSFDRFEELVHAAKEGGSFVPESDIQKYWVQTVREFYGDEGEVFTAYANIDHLWSYVSHFHHVPFYVYAYAAADLTVGSLYALYEQGHPNFERKFLDLLASGSTKDFRDIIAPFGLDAASPTYWLGALTGYIEPLIAEAEELAKGL